LRDNLNSVVSRSNEGKMEKSNGFSIFMEIKRIIKEKVMLNDSSKSRIDEGRGIIIIITTITAIKARIISPYFNFNSSFPLNCKQRRVLQLLHGKDQGFGNCKTRRAAG